MNTIDTIKAKSCYAPIAEYDENFQIIVEQNGKLCRKYISIKPKIEAKATRINIDNELVAYNLGYEIYITKIMETLTNDDFTVSLLSKSHTTIDNVLHVKKEGIDFFIRKNEFNDIEGIKNFFSVIKNIVNYQSNKNYVLYAEIEKNIREYIGFNNKYESIIFSKICNALRQRGIEINV
ncbi:hypothetical protein [Methanococcoides burtonii]|uniref:Uncharacterized protein n=1 Tax=Methanococcoides burtonii (strain DSM 6242 / NBRC 107633 / OCM 468 / ACE-M) TaxID=259564 RepID=Q12XZ8_METBU|nr:hypothetical protein [Methanococcoides burtonii]ABE51678.1 Hypothetical protein Mbur_0713 [Methanococcoides burtonii DSM 6242]